MQELLADEVVLLSGELDQARDLLRDRPFLLERQRDRRRGVVELGLGCVHAGHRYVLAGIEEVLDEHHRVVPLLHGLPVEMRCELRQRLRVVVHRDRDVLLRGCELAPDLLVDRGRETAHRRKL